MEKRKKILLVSAFYESGMPSLREHQYSRALVEGGYDVTLFTSTGSNVWRYSRSKMKPTVPHLYDEENSREFGFEIFRRRALIRISDFFIIIPPIIKIWQSDVVHVIEFRQGFTAVVALVAKLFRKPVVYDHEQRGDRNYSTLHRIDSLFRRLFIFSGSFFVDYVRHTVLANRQHFVDNSVKKSEMTFCPLGADEDYFFYSSERRSQVRAALDVENEKLLLITGKITDIKRPVDIVKAGVASGYIVVLVGRVDSKLQDQIVNAGGDNVRLVGWQPMEELNKYFCAADVVVFTAFSVSYWEAAATGVNVVVPRSTFSDSYLADEPNFHLFGAHEMFVVEDEFINPDYELIPDLRAVLQDIDFPDQAERRTVSKFLWLERRKSFIDWYRSRFCVR